MVVHVSSGPGKPADVAHLLQVVVRREEAVEAQSLRTTGEREHLVVARTLLGLDEDA